MNAFIARFYKTWSVTDHWPTFNVADIFICIGVGLMAVDMVTSRRKPAIASEPAPALAAEPAPAPAQPAANGETPPPA
jgi:signal peptidase II